MRKYVVELIGTFFLVITIGLTVIKPHDAGALAPLAIGSVLMAMIFAGGHISGAHYNPAVTVAVYLRGKCPLGDVAPYIAVQTLGAAAAASVVLFLKDNPHVETATPDVRRWLVAEFLYTFALCYVVLNVATAKSMVGNSFYGLAIAFTVVGGAYSVGVISGAAFNPAVAVGTTLMGLTSAGSLWIFFSAEFLGAILAALVFRALGAGE
jgi:aquaporin Z